MSVGNKKCLKSLNKHIFITLAIMAFIFIQSALPGEISGAESNVLVEFFAKLTRLDAEVLSVVIRKAAHFTEFAVLGLCLTLNVRDFYSAKGISLGRGHVWFMSWLLGTAYAATDEIHQYFVPDRACQLLDVCIDSAGVAAGAIIGVVVCGSWVRKSNKPI